MAIIDVFPGSPTAIQDAVNTANPGDVILVHNGTYHEDVTIPTGKNNIRIVAKHKHQAVLNGENNLNEAFLLNNVTGVEIRGFTIKKYRINGINVTGGATTGGFNRIVANVVKDILNQAGIRTVTNGNLFWRNTVKRTGEAGIRVDNPGSSNWIIGNVLHNNRDDDIDVFGPNNAIIHNSISKSNFEAIFSNSSSTNTLVFDNEIFDNGDAVEVNGPNWVIIHNEIQTSKGDGVQINNNNTFLADNEIERNAQSGINIFSNFNIAQENEIERNENNGLFIQPTRTGNFVYRNDFEDNEPRNIKDLGVDNNFLENEF